MHFQYEGLVDRIYEAAVLPDHWPAVLEDLSGIADGDAGLLFTLKDGVQR